MRLQAVPSLTNAELQSAQQLLQENLRAHAEKLEADRRPVELSADPPDCHPEDVGVVERQAERPVRAALTR